jgi:hypothetical protein
MVPDPGKDRKQLQREDIKKEPDSGSRALD